MSREPDTERGQEAGLTTGQVSLLLGVAPSTVRRYADAGVFGEVRKLPSGQRRYNRAAVQEVAVSQGGAVR